MKFQHSIEINKPRDLVVKLWSNPDYYKEWQDGFEKIEYREGEPGKNGSVARIYFSNKGQKLELREVILNNGLPETFSARYEHIHMTNNLTAWFEVIDDNRTRMTQEIAYTDFHSFMPKLMSWLFPAMFKKPVQKWMNQFKDFAERMPD